MTPVATPRTVSVPARRPGRAARALAAVLLTAGSVAWVQSRPAAAAEPGSVAEPAPPTEPALPTEPPAPARIMALGDSITQGYPTGGGYRPPLAARLAAAGRPADFVGTQHQGPPGFDDPEHEGHGGFRIAQVRAGVPGWMAATAPDVVLVMIGTNDVLGNFDPTDAPVRLRALLDTISTARPTASVLVSSIPPIGPAHCACQALVDAYNSALPPLVEARAAAGYPVSFVDMAAVSVADLGDGIHPDDVGYAKIADAWYEALQALPAGPRPAGPAPPPDDRGFWLAGRDGGVFAFGGAVFHGSAAGLRLNRPVVGMASTPTGRGYWLVAADGAVLAFGDARYYGAASSLRLNRPIVGIAAMPTGRGYWLAASDGGIFAFGDARFFGSTGALALNRPVAALAATPSGGGYWLVASDGGVFSFGDAVFAGSAATVPLRSDMVALAPTPTGAGYWSVASDGGVFAFGDAAYHGSLTGPATVRVTGIAADGGGRGYVVTTAAGEVRGFGGPAVGVPVPVVGAAKVAGVARAGW